MNSKGLVVEFNDLNCLRCRKLISIETKVSLKTCSHNFCQKCIDYIIRRNHDKLFGTVNCPIKNCNCAISQNDIEEILGEDYEAFKFQIEINKQQKDDSKKNACVQKVTNNDFIKNFRDFRCSKCDRYILKGTGVCLKNCLDNFCLPCLEAFIKEKYDRNIGTVKCPAFYCNSDISQEEIEAIIRDNDNIAIEIQPKLNLHLQETIPTVVKNYSEYKTTLNGQQINVIFNDDNSDVQPKSNKQLTLVFNDEAAGVLPKTRPQINFAFSDEAVDVQTQSNGQGNGALDLFYDAQDKKDPNENIDGFYCPKCFKFIANEVGIKLIDCLHSFCQPCLEEIIRLNHDGIYGTVRCQVENCDRNISQKEIQAVLGEDGYEAFKYQLKLNRQDDHGLHVIFNQEPFECKICYNDIDVEDGILLQNCSHIFCKDCIIKQIVASEEYDIKCLGECQEFIQECEISYLISPEDNAKRIKQKSLNIAKNTNEFIIECFNNDCSNIVEITPGMINFRCNFCNKINCVNCKAIHDGTCFDYQEEINPDMKKGRLNKENYESEATIKQLIEAGQAMRCPRCTIPVIKIAGCDFLTCTACKLGICWCTKKSRNPFQKGDGTIVEGCKCKEPPTGARCHPNCGNCH